MRAAAGILCAVALLSGCGGDDDETTVVETTTVTETETETVPVPPEADATTPAEPDADAPGEDDGDGAAEAPGNCGEVTFEENTDSGAFDVTAVGTDCTTARRVALAARNSTRELTYVAHGFRCSGKRSDKPALSSIEWFCVGAEREVVTFSTS